MNSKPYAALLANWRPLDACLKTNRKISDVDGILDFAGFVVFIEHKLPGQTVPVGQQWLLRNVTKLNPQRCVYLVIWSDGGMNAPERLQVWKGGRCVYDKPTTLPILHRYLSEIERKFGNVQSHREDTGSPREDAGSA